MGATSLPRIVYIVREEDGDDSYLCAWESIDGIDNGVVVGTYILNAEETISVRRVLTPIVG